ncbi:MAG: peroxide stress protein YaaA [Mariprofundaceae bacterium]
MLTLISPAKKLSLSKQAEENFDSTQPQLLDESKILIKQLATYHRQEIADVMYLSDKLAELNRERFLAWNTPFTHENARQSIFTFKGDVYQAFDSASLSADDIDYSQTSLCILSGLYGVLRPLDLMQAYRLEMGTKLQNERGKNLYAFWGCLITDQLNAALATQKSKTLINLASAEYAKAVQFEHLQGDVITPQFKEFKNNTYKVVGIHAKKARGKMARFIIQNRLESPRDLHGFNVDGYTFQKELSSDQAWVYTR